MVFLKENLKEKIKRSKWLTGRRPLAALFVGAILWQGGQYFINNGELPRELQCNISQNTNREITTPINFKYADYQKVLQVAVENYLDPKRVNMKRIFFSSANAALEALPYSLSLMTKDFYKNRRKYLKLEGISPGKAIEITKMDPYIIFVPDYQSLQKMQKARERRNKKMSQKDRKKYVLSVREEQRQLQKYNDTTIKNIQFDKKDFLRIIDWIRENGEGYLTYPVTVNGKKKKKSPRLEMNKIFFSASNGALRALDPHSAIIPKRSWKKALVNAEDSTFEGIGAMLRGGGLNKVIIETPLPGSPALKSGIRAGDVIVKVDGESIDQLSLDQVVKRIRGPKNTIVRLEIERELELKRLTIPIKRNIIEQKAVTSKLLSKEKYDVLIKRKSRIGYIKINSFLYARENTSKLVRDEYRKLTGQGQLNYLILDLRNNPGGYLEEAVSVADLFLPKGKKVVQIKSRNSASTLKTRDKAEIRDIPIIILINANSASASEILASAMIDYDQALVVGDRSFGKATVQGIQPLDKVILKLTTARYYAPKGYTVQVSGVSPDIFISDEIDRSFPPSFREEDMWEHLPSLNQPTISKKRKQFLSQIKKKVGANTNAENYINKHKNDAIKVDCMLIRSIAYLYSLDN